MMYPLVRELADEGIPIVVICRVLGFCKQAYFQWLAKPLSNRDWENAHRINAAYDIHAVDPGLGYRLINDEVKRLGMLTSEPRMWKLCNSQKIWSVSAKKRRKKYSKVLPPVHDDLVRHKFFADTANKIWVVDITEHPTKETKLYMCAIKDMFSNKIVGYSIAKHMQASLAVAALENAVKTRKPVGTIVHSDRGVQFQSALFRNKLVEHGLLGSMGQVGAAGDNAAMESFFALLQKNVLDLKKWDSYQILRLAVVEWVEKSYHRKRRQRRLGCLTPVEFETVYKAGNKKQAQNRTKNLTKQKVH